MAGWLRALGAAAAAGAPERLGREGECMGYAWVGWVLVLGQLRAPGAGGVEWMGILILVGRRPRPSLP